MNRDQEMKPATDEQIADAERLKATTDRALKREKQYVDRVSPEARFETIRGVTFPVEPGSSRLRVEIERKKAMKRMAGDDRSLARLKAAIEATKK